MRVNFANIDGDCVPMEDFRQINELKLKKLKNNQNLSVEECVNYLGHVNQMKKYPLEKLSVK